MVRRHKRRHSMNDTERMRFVREATEIHRGLGAYLFALDPRSEDYKAVLAVRVALQQAIHAVTGEEAEWCRVKPGAYPR